ncbi:hypothetical protein JS533_007060 [Bifidobacterium amazonense]|uniref:Uridine kinase n=1 Tax=Bifidobacterium amazonense TaxID=2809027 RepID=A0ABS9VVE4_9BIFI|nr:hypothetical protein [Bifidobacterium amazonense]MCH9276032.1 hypothetical protein [Bifidobacterium amazonense]
METRHDTNERHGGTAGTRRWMTAGLAALCLCLPGGCSATPAGDDTGTTYASQLPSDDRIADLETVAKRFVACLTERGLVAKLADTLSLTMDGSTTSAPQTTVVLRTIGADGNPVETDGYGIETDASIANLYGNVQYRLTGSDGSWFAVSGSAALADTPYASRQSDYAACEAANPDFSQPPLSGDAARPKPNPQVQQAMLEFALKARKAGFDWVADPGPNDYGNTLSIPDTVSAEEFRRFLETFPADDRPDFSILFSQGQEELQAIYNGME